MKYVDLIQLQVDAFEKCNTSLIYFDDVILEIYYLCNSTDNFLSPIPVSDWLIFCCGNLILHQKKEQKIKKPHIFLD